MNARRRGGILLAVHPTGIAQTTELTETERAVIADLSE